MTDTGPAGPPEPRSRRAGAGQAGLLTTRRAETVAAGYRWATVESFSPLRAEWTALGEQVGHPFASYEWLSLWWTHFGDRRHRLVMVTARDSAGALAGIVALYRVRVGGLRVLRFVGHGPSDQLGPVVPAGSGLTGPALLSGALAHLGGHEVIYAEELAADQDWAAVLGAQRRRHVDSPVLELAGADWETLLASRSAHLRKKVRQAERALARGHQLHYRLATEPATLVADFAVLARLHNARWGGPTAFTDSTVAAFHRNFARVAAERGWLRLWFCELDGTPVAARYELRFANAAWAYNGGRNPDFDRAQVGFVLRNHTIRDATEAGLASYRFLRGDEAYKLRWATSNAGLDTVLAGRGPVGTAAVAAGTRLHAWSPRLASALRRTPADPN